MSFTLRSVSVYNSIGMHRTVRFRYRGLNILTARSKTGKSSIIDILDYCFGRSECLVAEGVIREQVAWFGVEIANNDDYLFIARRNPGPGRRTSADIYIRRGQHESPPAYGELHKNITRDALISLLTRFSGIAENEHRPLTGTRQPLQATIRHALFLCFQKQDEIASRDRLFHRQGEQFIPQAIKDTIPYFIGAVDEQHFLRQYELDEAKRALNQLQARRDAMQNNDTIKRQIRKAYSVARSVGLVDDHFDLTDVEPAVNELKRILTVDPRSPMTISEPSGVVGQLEDELHALHRQLIDVRDRIRATNDFVKDQNSYASEVREQRERLVSLNLYTGESVADHICPLCEAHIEAQTPATSDLMRSLRVLDNQLMAVVSEHAHLQEHLHTLGNKRIEIENAIVSRQRDLERAYADRERSRVLRDQAINRARAIGHIGALLEQIDLSDEKYDIDILIAECQKQVDVLVDQLSIDDIEERVYTFLSLIAHRMTTYASDLKLEHAEQRMRLDLKNLSVIAETVSGPIPLRRIGSGENRVGYHIVTFLALHHWFRTQNRPVPGILVFDQPSQAHYPPDADRRHGVDMLEDADRRAVHKMFEFMYKASKEIGEGFQLIVLDHAHLDQDWFDDSVVEEWREDRALIPNDWLDTNRTSPT